jgi:acyl-CoA dehydrogenase
LEQDFQDIELLISDAASGLLADAAPIGSDAARACAEEGRWFAPGWTMLAEAGFPQAMRPEEEGGVGCIGAMLIARMSGAAALALPLADAMAADWLLARAGAPPVEGPLVLAAQPLDFNATPAGVRIAGSLDAVPWARDCKLVCMGKLDGALVAVILDRAEFAVTQGANLADEPRDMVQADITVAPERVIALPADLDLDTPRQLGAVLRTAQMAGAAEAAVDMTVAYARDRKQFGRSLAGFQAVQQLLAIIATEAAAARMASDMAAASLARGMDARTVAVAKIRAGEAAGKIARTVHQIHGAIGYTRELPLQLLTRRLWSWRDEYGGEAEWSIALGRSLAADGRALWASITDIGA